jgi:hypothetical protein
VNFPRRVVLFHATHQLADGQFVPTGDFVGRGIREKLLPRNMSPMRRGEHDLSVPQLRARFIAPRQTSRHLLLVVFAMR